MIRALIAAAVACAVANPVTAQVVSMKLNDTLSVTVSTATKANPVLKMSGSRYVCKAAGVTTITANVNASANKKTKLSALDTVAVVYCATVIPIDSTPLPSCNMLDSMFAVSNDTTVADTSAYFRAKSKRGCIDNPAALRIRKPSPAEK